MKKVLKSILEKAFVVLMILAVLVLGFPVTDSVSAATPGFKTKSISIYTGKTKALDLGKPANEIIWKSADETIATVDDGGLVTAVSVGTTKITATYKNVDYSCKVKVKQKTLTPNEVEVFPFEYFQLTLNGTTAKSWKCSDESIVYSQRVYENTFRLRALAEGDAIFTIKGKDKQEYSCHVIVKPCTYTASYYDKKKTKVKNISYYVDGKLKQYDSYTKNNGLKYSLKYEYYDDKYVEYKEVYTGLLSKTVYDYNDRIIGEATYRTSYNHHKTTIETADDNIISNWYYVFDNEQYTKYTFSETGLTSKTTYDNNDTVIHETTYYTGASLDTADDNIITDKYLDSDGNWKTLEYSYVPQQDGTNQRQLYFDGLYNIKMQPLKEINYTIGNNTRVESTYYPEDGTISFQTKYENDRKIYDHYYNQSPYYMSMRIDYYDNGKTVVYFDSSGKNIRTEIYDEYGNLKELYDEYGNSF